MKAKIPGLILLVVLAGGCARRVGPDSTGSRNEVYASPDGAETVTHLRPGTMGGVYLVQQDSSYLLIDTGVYSTRPKLVQALAEAGCRPDNLALIVITHGHWDHTGNAAYLRQAFRAPLLMHARDVSMAETGVVPTRARKYRPFMVRLLAPLFLVLYSGTITDQREHFEPFSPDIIVEGDEVDLRSYGFEASVIHIPGHSSGSIGVITAGGSFFAGDILVNFRDKPAFNTGMADESFRDLDRSVAKVSGMEIRQVFPGHGMPFPWEALRTRQAR